MKVQQKKLILFKVIIFGNFYSLRVLLFGNFRFFPDYVLFSGKIVFVLMCFVTHFSLLNKSSS